MVLRAVKSTFQQGFMLLKPLAEPVEVPNSNNEGSQSDVQRSPMQPQMFIILGMNMILGFTSEAAQLWEDPSLIHTLLAPLCCIFVHTMGCTQRHLWPES